jgi:hypothetical protein
MWEAHGQIIVPRLDAKAGAIESTRKGIHHGTSTNRSPVLAENGHRELLTEPGLGIAIDENKMMAEVGEPQEYKTLYDPDYGSVVDW